MDATSSPGLYPFHRCKTLHLVCDLAFKIAVFCFVWFGLNGFGIKTDDGPI